MRCEVDYHGEVDLEQKTEMFEDQKQQYSTHRDKTNVAREYNPGGNFQVILWVEGIWGVFLVFIYIGSGGKGGRPRAPAHLQILAVI